MKEAMIFFAGYATCMLSVVVCIAFGRVSSATEEPFTDDPRPALLREQAE